MGGTSSICYVPTFECEDVNRENGTMAIVSKTSIEIKEILKKYIQKK